MSANEGELPDRVESFYADNRWLRAGVALIPWVGGAIDALITTRASLLVQRRVETLLEELRNAATRLDGTKIDGAFLETEEWADLVFQTFRAASETRDREKIRTLAAILIGASRTDRDPVLDAESVLSGIANLSPLELEEARALWDAQTAHGTDDSDLDLIGAQYRWTQVRWPTAILPNLIFHLKRLEGAGLVSEYTGAYWDYGGGVYAVTATFRRLMRQLRQSE